MDQHVVAVLVEQRDDAAEPDDLRTRADDGDDRGSA
jgi:hypothetical protein